MESKNTEDLNLIKKAQKRVSFKIHFFIYAAANIFLWLLWYFIISNANMEKDVFLNFCLFTSLGWGVIVLAHYMIIYKWNQTLVDKEFSKLKKQQEKQSKNETHHINP